MKINLNVKFLYVEYWTVGLALHRHHYFERSWNLEEVGDKAWASRPLVELARIRPVIIGNYIFCVKEYLYHKGQEGRRDEESMSTI